MNITLTPEQTELIEQKLESGRYESLEELVAQALDLLNDWDEQSLLSDRDWLAQTQQKVDSALTSLDQNGGNDGETTINQLLQRFQKSHGAEV